MGRWCLFSQFRFTIRSSRAGITFTCEFCVRTYQGAPYSCAMDQIGFRTNHNYHKHYRYGLYHSYENCKTPDSFHFNFSIMYSLWLICIWSTFSTECILKLRGSDASSTSSSSGKSREKLKAQRYKKRLF